MGYTYLQDPIFYFGKEEARIRVHILIKNCKYELEWLTKIEDMLDEGKDYEEIAETCGHHPKKLEFDYK